MRGATDCPDSSFPVHRDFNPRTPCGVRHGRETTVHTFGRISIHAPHAGCDIICGGRIARVSKFQSTHPMRGATKKRSRSSYSKRNFNPRTPCGVRPLAGCKSRFRRYFNPRTPCGVRPGPEVFAIESGDISIHAPHAGCDNGQKRPHAPYGAISIHAPHAGCDYYKGAQDILSKISIHAPHAGCDVIHPRLYSHPSAFQSTHPMRGATRTFLLFFSTVSNFNPRTPCGVRLACRHGI